MGRRIAGFLSCEDAAVSIDWVVLTAGIVAFNIIGVMAFLEGGMEGVGNAILSSILTTVDDP